MIKLKIADTYFANEDMNIDYILTSNINLLKFTSFSLKALTFLCKYTTFILLSQKGGELYAIRKIETYD